MPPDPTPRRNRVAQIVRIAAEAALVLLILALIGIILLPVKVGASKDAARLDPFGFVPRQR